jgi:hypothetical protein
VAILDCQTVLRARAVMEAIGRCIDSTTKPLPCLRRMFLDKIAHFVESGKGHRANSLLRKIRPMRIRCSGKLQFSVACSSEPRTVSTCCRPIRAMRLAAESSSLASPE